MAVSCAACSVCQCPVVPVVYIKFVCRGSVPPSLRILCDSIVYYCTCCVSESYIICLIRLYCESALFITSVTQVVSQCPISFLSSFVSGVVYFLYHTVSVPAFSTFLEFNIVYGKSCISYIKHFVTTSHITCFNQYVCWSQISSAIVSKLSSVSYIECHSSLFSVCVSVAYNLS